jgi:hypothetical protein
MITIVVLGSRSVYLFFTKYKTYTIKQEKIKSMTYEKNINKEKKKETKKKKYLYRRITLGHNKTKKKKKNNRKNG